MKRIVQHYPECQHFQIAEVKNGLGKVIGAQCSQCRAVVWGVGKCAGCGKDNRKLTFTVDEAKYCSEQCRRAAKAAPGPGR